MPTFFCERLRFLFFLINFWRVKIVRSLVRFQRKESYAASSVGTPKEYLNFTFYAGRFFFVLSLVMVFGVSLNSTGKIDISQGL